VNGERIVSYLIAAAGIITAVGALIGAVANRRQGVSGDEREARRVEAEQRRDTIADRDQLIDQMQEQYRDLVPRVERLERDLEDERAYSRLLVDHIYRGNPPPPPPRPVRP
jgi:transposase